MLENEDDLHQYHTEALHNRAQVHFKLRPQYIARHGQNKLQPSRPHHEAKPSVPCTDETKPQRMQVLHKDTAYGCQRRHTRGHAPLQSPLEEANNNVRPCVRAHGWGGEENERTTATAHKTNIEGYTPDMRWGPRKKTTLPADNTLQDSPARGNPKSDDV